MGLEILGRGLSIFEDINYIAQTYADDIGLRFGTGNEVKFLYETADANANHLNLVFSEGGSVDVPVLVIGDASIDNVDLGWFNGQTEPAIVIVNDAADAYASLDAGDDAVAGSKGLYFKSAADEDVELINMSLTGTPRIYWDESEDQFRSTKGWVFDAACDVQGTWVATAAWTLPALTLGGTVTVNSQVFNAGALRFEIDSTITGDALRIVNTNDDTIGSGMSFMHISASPAVADRVCEIDVYGRDALGANVVYGRFSWQITNITDTTEASKLVMRLHDAGAENVAMELSGAGVLSVDLAGVGTAAQVDLFDDYDDALILRQGIQQNNRELLADMGVLTRKDTGSGFMLNLQPMVRLLAGGIYQSRQRIEDLRDELSKRVDRIEARQDRLLQGG